MLLVLSCLKAPKATVSERRSHCQPPARALAAYLFSSKRLNPQCFNVRINTPSQRSFPLHTEVSGSAPEDAFGSFRVLHQIGAGVLGPVFRAYDAERDRMVAVKLFRLDLPPDRIHRLVAEFEKLIAAELTHPGIAAPIETGIAGTNAYLAQDYVAAESLDTSVRDHGPAPFADALRVAAELAGALDFAAVVGIAHGALHPRDVLLSAEESRLTGIGIARALEQVGGVVLVRRPYAAPERAAASTWSRRADIFSLAAVMHEMLWGRRIVATGARAADALTELPGGDLERLRAAFARGLAEDPAERYETALEFAAALKEAFPDDDSHQSPVVNPQSVVVSPQSRVRGHKSRTRLKAGDSGLATWDLGLTTEAPRLPLGEPEPAGELDLRALDLQVAEAERFADVETAPAIGESAAAPSTAGPAAQTPFSAYEESRSAVWPLLLALGVGVALGFAGGYGIGVRERALPASTPSPAAPPSGREFTERTVSEPAVRTVDTAAALTTDNAEPAEKSSSAASESSAVAKAAAPRMVKPVTPLKAPAAARAAGVAPRPDNRGRPPRPIEPGRRASVPPAAETTGRIPAPPATVGPSVGALIVESRPSGANVFVDNRLIGTTPFSLSEIVTGEHTVRIELSGYRRWSSPVRIIASERNRVTASLER